MFKGVWNRARVPWHECFVYPIGLPFFGQNVVSNKPLTFFVMKPNDGSYVRHCTVRANTCTCTHVNMNSITYYEALARLRCLGQLIVGHKSLQREWNGIRDIEQQTQAQLKQTHCQKHTIEPLVRGSPTFLHTRHLPFDPHNVINEGGKRAEEKDRPRR